MTNINISYTSQRADLASVAPNAHLLMAGHNGGLVEIVRDLNATARGHQGKYATLHVLCRSDDWDHMAIIREDLIEQLERTYSMDYADDESQPGGEGLFVLTLAIR